MSEIAMITSKDRRPRRPRGSLRGPSRVRPWLEVLENRLVLSSVSLSNPKGGDWETANNWSSASVPTVGDDVVISINSSNSYPAVTVTNGLTFNGAIKLGGTAYYGTLNFVGSQSLSGTDSIVFGNES
jgi:hypothetical protein